MNTWIIPYEQYFSGAELMAMTSLTILERETSIHKSKKAASFWLLGQHSKLPYMCIQTLLCSTLRNCSAFIYMPHENETNPKISQSKHPLLLVRLRKRLIYIVFTGKKRMTCQLYFSPFSDFIWTSLTDCVFSLKIVKMTVT